MAKETYYFSHDYNAFQDPKVLKMVLKLGMESYGIYWAIVEMIYSQDGKIEADFELLAYKFFIDIKKIESIINDFKLFKVKKGFISSDSIDRRLLLRREKSDKARQSSLQRRSISERSTNDDRTISERSPIKERKGKYNKKEKSDQNPASEKADFVAPTFVQVREYFHEAKLYESNPVTFFAEFENKLTADWKQQAINYANGN